MRTADREQIARYMAERRAAVAQFLGDETPAGVLARMTPTLEAFEAGMREEFERETSLPVRSEGFVKILATLVVTVAKNTPGRDPALVAFAACRAIESLATRALSRPEREGDFARVDTHPGGVS